MTKPDGRDQHNQEAGTEYGAVGDCPRACDSQAVHRAVDDLRVIRQLMERPVRYSTQSGLAGVIAGVATLAGVYLDWQISHTFEFSRAVPYCAIVWAGVLTVAFVAVFGMTWVRERRQNMPFWSAIKKRILRTIWPPAVAGIGLTLAIVYRSYTGMGPNQWGLVPAIWMCCYGIACCQLGDLAIPELRRMGVIFLLIGLLSAVFMQFNVPYLTAPGPGGLYLGATRGTAAYWLIGSTFGGLHILYGIVVWKRYGG